jgi:aspartyl-tRNA synthetase
MINDDVKQKILKHDHNTIFLIADKADIAYKLAGKLRIDLGERLNLIDQNTFAFCFITDFPMFELNNDGKWDFMHNPFSKPQNIDAPIHEILAYQYDTVCNGYELSSGAVRNYDLDMVKRIFTLIGDNCENLEERFPLYKAFKYGVPPHAGSAPGIDRIIMLLCNKTNVRDIVAFPLNQNGESLLMEAPSKIDEKLLKELKIKHLE